MAEQIGLQAVLDIDDFVRNAGRYQDAIDDMDSKTSSFAGSAVSNFQSFGDGVLKASAVVGTAFVAATAAAAAAVGAFVAKGISAAADLEAQLDAIVSTIDKGVIQSFGGAEKATSALNDKILELGLDPNLKVTATEAADAIQQLVANGVPLKDVLDGAAHSTVLLANATGADFATAGNIASDVMSIFKLKTDDLAGAVSNISGVVNESKFTINDYRLALAQGGGVASAAGVSFKDFNATIAAISPLFASGSDAGTSFKTLIQSLNPKSKEAAKAMRQLGLEFYDANGNMKSMSDIAGELNRVFNGTITTTQKVGGATEEQQKQMKHYAQVIASTRQKLADYQAGVAGVAQSENDKVVAVDRLNRVLRAAQAEYDKLAGIQGTTVTSTRKLTEEEKNHYLSVIFGTDASRAAIALAEIGSEKFNELAAAIGGVDANEQAAQRMSNFKGALEILQGQIDTIQISIGQKFLPVLTALAQWASNWVSQYTPAIIAAFTEFATQLEAVINWAQIVVTDGDIMNDWLTHMSPNVQAVVLGLVDFVAQTQAFIAAAQATIGPIIAVVSQFVSWKDVLITVGLAVASVVIPAIWGFIAALVPVIATVGAVILAVAALRNAWESDFLGIQTGTIAAINYITGALAPFTSSVTEHFSGALTEIKNFALGNQTEFTNVAAIWDGAKASANTLFTDLSSYVTTNLPIWTATLTTWGNAAWQWILDAIPIVTQKLTEWYTAIATYIVTNYPTWLAAMALWGNAVWQWVVDSIPVVTQKLTEWYTALSTWVTDNWPIWKAKLIEWANVLWGWVLDAIPVITEKLGEWYTALSNWVTENWPTWKAKLIEWANVLWGWIVDAAGQVGAKLGEWYAALEQYITDNWPAWKAKLLEWANAAWQWIVDAAGQVGAKLGEWYAALSQYVTDNLPTWKAKLLEWSNAAWEWIKDAAGKVGEKLGEWYAALKQYVTDNLPAWKAKLLEWAGALWEWIKDAASKIPGELTKWYTSLSGAISGKLPTLRTKMLEWATVLVSWIGDKAADALPELGKWMGKILAWIPLGVALLVAGVAKLTKVLIGWISGGEDSAEKQADPAMDKFKEALNTAIGKVWVGIKAAVQAMLTLFKEEINKYVDWRKVGEDLMTSVKDGIASMENAIVKVFQDIVAKGKKVFKDAVASFKQIGSDIIQGIIDGAGEMGSALTEYFSTLISDLIQRVKEGLGIASPSKVFMAIGRNVVQGFMDGIRNEWEINRSILGDLFLFAIPKSSVGGTGYWDLPSGLSKAKDVASGLLNVFKKLADMSPSANHSGMSAAVQGINDSLTTQLDLLDQIEKAGLDPRGVLGDTWMGIGADPGKLADSIFEVTKLAQQKLNNEVINRRNSLISKFVLQPFTDALTNQAKVITDTLKGVATDFGKIRIDRILSQIADVDKQIANLTQISNQSGLNPEERKRFVDLVNQRGTLAAQIGATGNIEGLFNISSEATRLEQMKKQVDLLKQARDLSADIPADAFGNIANDSTLRALIEVYAHVQNAQLNQLQSQLSTLQSNNIQAQLNQYKAQQAALDSQIALLQKAKDLGLQLPNGSSVSDMNSLSLNIAQEQLRRTQNELAIIRGIPANLLNLSPTNSVAQLYKSQVLDPMLKTLREAVMLDSERADLMAKYVAGAEKVQALNDKQGQLDYLKFQADLIKQVNDTFSAAGAKTVLADTHFGLDASLDDLLAFAGRMVNGMVNKVKHGLGIASPSKVFIDIGQRVMQGFSRGMESMADKPIMAINQALRPLPYAYAGGQRTMNVNMGGVSISNGMDDVMFEHRVRQVVEGLLG